MRTVKRQPWIKGVGVVLLWALLLLVYAGGVSAQSGSIDVTIHDADVAIEPGDDIVYTIQAVNSTAAITAETVALTVTTPVSVTFAECGFQAPFTGVCTPLANGAAISLNETLAPTTTAVITMRVNTALDLATNVSTAVTLSATGPVSNTGSLSNTGQLSQTILSAGPATVETEVLLPNLQLSVDDGLTAGEPGAEFTYQLTAQNTGAGTARAVQLSLHMPSGVVLVSATAGGAPQSEGSTTIAWPVTDIAAGGVITRAVTVRVDNPLADGTLLHAEAAATRAGTDAVVTDSDDTTVVATSLNVRLWRDLDGNGVVNGNEAGIAGVNLQITAGAQILTRTTNATGMIALTGIPAATYTVLVAADSVPTAFLKTHESDGSLDNRVSVTTTPGPASSVSFGYAAPAAVAESFLLLDFNENNLRDAGEPGLAGMTVSLRGAGVDGQFDTADDLLRTTMSDSVGRYAFSGLLPGRYRITLDTTTTPIGYILRAEADQTVDGTLNVTLTDSQVAVGHSFFYTAVDLFVAQTDESRDVTTGMQVPYRITFTNTGPIPAQQVRLFDVVPEYADFDADTSSPGWTCEDEGGPGATCTYDVGVMEPGASGSVYFSVRVADRLPIHIDSIVNTVQIADLSSVAPDPTPLNNRAVSMTPVRAGSDLYIKQTDGGTRIAPGQILAYTVTYGNQGNRDASDVRIVQVVPPNTLFRAAGSTPGWDCADGSVEGTVCTFVVGTLPAATEHELIFVLEIARSMPVNVLTIDAEVFIRDGSGLASSDAELTPVDSAPDLQLEKQIENLPVEPGGIIRFHLTFTNHGNQDAIGVLLVETVPEYTSFSAVNSSLGWTCQDQGQAGDNCMLQVGSLEAFASGDAVFAVRVDPFLPPYVEEIGSTAVIAGSGIERDILNNEAPGRALITRPTAVDLLSFTLEPGGQGVLLEWATSAERNSWGFLIHRSTDRQWLNGQTITRMVIESVGNESSGSTYTFLDENVVPGVTYYYWLQELERSGATSIYGPISGKIVGSAPGSGIGLTVYIPLVNTQP